MAFNVPAPSRPLCHKAFVRLCRLGRHSLVGAHVSHTPASTHTRNALAHVHVPAHPAHPAQCSSGAGFICAGVKNNPAHPAPGETMQNPATSAPTCPPSPAGSTSLRGRLRRRNHQRRHPRRHEWPAHLLRRRKRPRCGHEIAGQRVTLAETVIGPLVATAQTAGAKNDQHQGANQRPARTEG